MSSSFCGQELQGSLASSLAKEESQRDFPVGHGHESLELSVTPSRSLAGLFLCLTAMGSSFASLCGGGLGGPAAPPSCAGAAHSLLSS